VSLKAGGSERGFTMNGFIDSHTHREIKAIDLKVGDGVVGKVGQIDMIADVVSVTVMASGVLATLSTEYGEVSRQYDYDETITVERV